MLCIECVFGGNIFYVLSYTYTHTHIRVGFSGQWSTLYHEEAYSVLDCGWLPPAVIFTKASIPGKRLSCSLSDTTSAYLRLAFPVD